ncbi:MAG: OprO/OprP family phosphate-selective porin, partial [Planctomycetota bacterium]
MKMIVRSALAVLGLVATARSVRAEGTTDTSLATEVNRYLEETSARQEDPTVFKFVFKDGIRAETSDKSFSVKIGGRVMNDWFWKDADDPVRAAFAGVSEDGVTFRRARLHIQGTMYKNIDFSAEFDFASGTDAAFRDVYIGLKKVPGVGNFRVGHFKEPMSLEELTSSRNITFMERSMPVNAFVQARNTGFMVFNTALEDRLTWAVGLFRQTDETTGAGVDQDGSYAGAFRITGVPYQVPDEKTLVHVGFSASFRDPAGDAVQLRTRPDVATGPRVVDTGSLTGVEDLTLFGFEAAVVWKSLSFQAEFFIADLSGVGDPQFSGFYVMVSYWVTGESRPYDAKEAKFD